MSCCKMLRLKCKEHSSVTKKESVIVLKKPQTHLSYNFKNELSGLRVLLVSLNYKIPVICDSYFILGAPQCLTLQPHRPVERTLIVHFWGAFILLALGDWSSQQ